MGSGVFALALSIAMVVGNVGEMLSGPPMGLSSSMLGLSICVAGARQDQNSSPSNVRAPLSGNPVSVSSVVSAEETE
eukprot:6513386-Lingulodinium_polyedra.AAC.1